MIEPRLRGTYAGLASDPSIEYLKRLGVTAVELMPVHEFPIKDIWGQKPNRPNYWGYDPMAFFSPHRGYQSSDKPGHSVSRRCQVVSS